MSFCGNKFGNCVGEGGVRANVEDGIGVFAIVHAAGGEDNGDKVDTGILE